MCNRCVLQTAGASHGRATGERKPTTLFLYSAVDTRGELQVGRIDAASLDAAKLQLHQRNLADVTFHTDEATVAYLRIEGMQLPEISAEQELANLREPQQGMALLRSSYAGNWIFWAPPVAWALWNIWHGAPYTIVDGVSVALALIGLLFSAYAALPVIRYHQLLDAAAWARWNDVRRHCAFIRRWRRYFVVGLPQFEIDVHDAKAVAAQGDLPAALASIEPQAEAMPRPAFLVRVAAIRLAGGDWEGALRCQEEAWRLSDGRMAETIDYALALVWRRHDADTTERLLAGIEDRARSIVMQAGFDYARGLVALERGRYDAASQHLERANAGYRENGAGAYTDFLCDLVAAHRAIARAHRGDKDSARTLLRESLPRLAAFNEHELARRCAAAVA